MAASLILDSLLRISSAQLSGGMPLISHGGEGMHATPEARRGMEEKNLAGKGGGGKEEVTADEIEGFVCPEG